MLSRPPHRQRTLIFTKLTQLTVKRMSRVFIFKLQVCRTIWHTEFIGDLVLVNCCPFEGGDVGQSMHWHTEGFMRVMFRSLSLAVRILVRERLEARCELLRSQTGNRPTTLATVRKHQLVEAAVTGLLWSRVSYPTLVHSDVQPSTRHQRSSPPLLSTLFTGTM